jgi:hypothetical protein
MSGAGVREILDREYRFETAKNQEHKTDKFVEVLAYKSHIDSIAGTQSPHTSLMFQ